MSFRLATLASPSVSSVKRQQDLKRLREFSEALRESFVTFSREQERSFSAALLESQDVPACSLSDSPSDSTSI